MPNEHAYRQTRSGIASFTIIGDRLALTGDAGVVVVHRSMMAGYLGSGGMTGDSSYRWMMSPSGYQWMTGGSGAPGWMSGGSLPGPMMGTSTDPGTIMGRLFASAPGSRISAAQTAALGIQAPAGAQINRPAQKTAMISQLKSHLDTMITAVTG